jgi:hypothetical protein
MNHFAGASLSCPRNFFNENASIGKADRESSAAELFCVIAPQEAIA